MSIALAVREPEQKNLSVSIYTDPVKFELAQKVAKLLSECTLFPPHFQGEKNMANCFVAMQLCNRIGEDPFLLMQKLYVVNGRLGMESQLAIALLHKSGFFKTRIKYRPNEKQGDAAGWIAYATDKEGNLCEEECTIDMAKKKGWWSKDKSNWPAMPDLMCKYRAAMLLGRLHCPEALMGMYTKDELLDLGEAEVITPRGFASDLDAALAEDDAPAKPAEIVKQPQQATQTAAAEHAAQEAEKAPEMAPEPTSAPNEAELRAWSKTLDKEAKARFGALAKGYAQTMSELQAAQLAYADIQNSMKEPAL